MTSKKPHTKSRLGCKHCKTRRIKCDERPPRCGHCTRKGLECDFQEYAAVFEDINILTPTTYQAGGAPHKEATRSSSVTQDRSITPQPSPSAGTFSMQDLGLLHHFTLHTCHTIPVVDSDIYCQIWREEVPRLAQSHAFLMHAVLGFAAAHQLAESDIDPATSDYNTLRCHYSQALTLFREAVVDISEERAEALLCFSILSSFLTLYLECGAPAEKSDPIDGLSTFLDIVRSSGCVLDKVRPALRGTTIGVLLSHTLVREQHFLDLSTKTALDVLDNLCATYLSSTQPTDCSDSNLSSLLLGALASLRELFILRDPSQKSWTHILRWSISLNPDFVSLLREDNPIALCAIAHWCVPIYHAPAKWYTANWPKRILLAIAQRLRGTQWEAGLAWPLRETIGSDQSL